MIDGTLPEGAPNPFDRFRTIVVEGPPGVGKNALCQALASRYHATTLLEQPSENPFLERTGKDPARHALPTQLHFLLERMNRLTDLLDGIAPNEPVVANFLLERDPLVAELTLAPDEFALYRRLLRALEPRPTQPDLVIFLQASPERLVARIRARAIQREALITEATLRPLCAAYGRFMHSYSAAPVLQVDTEHLDLAASEEHFSLLVDKLLGMRGRREFLNLNR